MKDYKAIFNTVEATLVSEGSRHLPIEEIRANLNVFKEIEGKTFSDNDYYRILVDVIFYSGFRAETVSAKLGLIHQYFPNYESVAVYENDKTQEILSNPKMIKNKRKIQACIDNARTFKAIISEYGSFQKYVAFFHTDESFENLMLLKEELEYRFVGLGKVTVYHFLTDIGMPVLKPDRVICRIFQRLGLIESERQLLKTVIQGRKFAQATGYPIRYIDIVFVAYGQMGATDFGLKKGICLEVNPVCSICGAKNYCSYFQ